MAKRTDSNLDTRTLPSTWVDEIQCLWSNQGYYTVVPVDLHTAVFTVNPFSGLIFPAKILEQHFTNSYEFFCKFLIIFDQMDITFHWLHFLIKILAKIWEKLTWVYFIKVTKIDFGAERVNKYIVAVRQLKQNGKASDTTLIPPLCTIL